MRQLPRLSMVRPPGARLLITVRKAGEPDRARGRYWIRTSDPYPVKVVL